MLPAEQQGQRGGGEGVFAEVRLNPVERRVAVVDNHIAHFEPAAVDLATAHAHDDEGQAPQTVLRHLSGRGHPFFEGDHHGATALRADVAAQLGEQ